MSSTARKLLVLYPSGASAKVTGEWLGPRSVMGDGLVDAVCIRPARDVVPARGRPQGVPIAAGSLLACDPRCVVVDLADLSVIYHPRTPTATITGELQAAMQADWPDSAFRAVELMKRRR